MSIPYVIESGSEGQERTYDLYSRMMKDRVVFVKGTVTSDMADAIVAQLLFLESMDPKEEIRMYINSPGGEVKAMFAMYDVMNYISCDVRTVAYGQAASAGSFILMAGTKGKRMALPNTDIMIHEMSGGIVGKAKDIRNEYKTLDKLDKKINKYLASFTGKTVKRIEKDTKLDYHMSADEALEYGIIDEVLVKRGE